MVRSFKALFAYKELLLNFAHKELKVKYKNSILGFFWSLLNPIMMMLVFTFVFGVIFPVKSVPFFPIFLLAGLLPWNFFSATVTGGTISIVANSGLVKKVYFPRELLPISIGLANLVNFFLEMGVFLVFVLIIGFRYHSLWRAFLFLPYLLVLAPVLFVFSLGVALFVAANNVYFRDVQHLVGIFLTVLFYGSPIIYDLKQVPLQGSLLLMYKMNPLVTLIMSFKNAFYWGSAPHLSWLLYSVATALLVFIAGYKVFLRLEPGFAEEI